MWESLDKFQKMKRERIAYIVYELWKREGKADLRSFRGSIAVEHGIRQHTLDEYLKDLKDYGVIEIDKNKIFLKWENEEVEKWLKKQGILPSERKSHE